MKTQTLALLLLTAPALVFGQSAESTSAQDARPDEHAPLKHGQVEQDARRDCVRYTGSRIVSDRNQRKARADEGDTADARDRDGCVAANGRVYSRDDLGRTGEIDVADALRKLDPAIY